jgi:hypothetical protein
MDQAYKPAYVEDLDIGYRAWQRGWPSVYVAGAVLEHRHRATASRYFTEEQLDEILEINYLKFVARAVASREVFRKLWMQALERLRIRAGLGPAPRNALRAAAGIALGGGPAAAAAFSEELLLALSGGGIAVFPGRAVLGTPRTLVAVSQLNSPAGPGVGSAGGLAAGPGAVLVAFTDMLETPPSELLAACAEVVLVRRSDGPLAFRAALRQTIRKWRPEVAYLQGDDMAQFAGDCAPARPVTSS